MNELVNLWNLILESNTFNFVVLIVILAIVMQKLHISDVIEKMKDEIIDKIEKSKLAKEDAAEYLADAKLKVEHLEEDIAKKIALADTQAHNVGETIKEAAQRKLKQIENNVEKVIEAEEKTIVTSLSDEASLESVRLAEQIIREKLAKDPSLHDRYINESIEELEKAVL
ncbi:ATP synthase F0 subunit B [bacterium]|nr:ATP synthase F0 subunit B [bacterium]